MKNNIRIERARHKMSQQQLAELTGVSRQTINAIEAGKYVPSGVLLMKIAQVFKLPVEQVFELEEND